MDLNLAFYDRGQERNYTPQQQALISGPHNYWIDASEVCSSISNGTRHFKDYMECKGTQLYLKALEEVPFHEGGMPGGPPDRSHIFRMGNTGFGHHAWICPRLLMDLVRWLSQSISVKLNHLVFTLLNGVDSYDGRAAMAQVIIYLHCAWNLCNATALEHSS